MAIGVGTTGSLILVGVTGTPACILVRKATLSMRRSSAEAFFFNATKNIKQRVAGPVHWSGTYEGYMDAATKVNPAANMDDAAQASATVTLQAQTSTPIATDVKFTGVGWLTSISPKVEVGQFVEVSGAFVIDGDVTATAAD